MVELFGNCIPLFSYYEGPFSLIQDSHEGTEDLNVELLRQLSSSLLPIAKRHEGYQTLWNICCDLNDLDLLRSLMVCKKMLYFVLLYLIKLVLFFPGLQY